MADIDVTIIIGGSTTTRFSRQAGEQPTAGSWMSGVERPHSAVELENIRVVQDHINAIKAHDLENVAKGLHENMAIVSDTRLGLHSSRRGTKENYLSLFQQLWQTFPDARYEQEGMVVQGNIVVVPWWGRGTQRGDWVGTSATGAQMDVHGCSYYRLDNQKIVEIWDYWDRTAVAHQAGRNASSTAEGGGWTGGGTVTDEAGSFASPSRSTLQEIMYMLQRLEGYLAQLAKIAETSGPPDQRQTRDADSDQSDSPE